jgi:hypothetical protein
MSRNTFTADAELVAARGSLEAYMFGEQAVTKTDPAAPYSFNLVVTSARGPDGAPEKLLVRRGTMRVFRPDPGVDEFTRRGGWHWTSGKTEGRTQFARPGGLVLVVHETDGTIRWYALELDTRC